METLVFFVTLGLILGTILIVFGMKYISATYQSRSRINGENAYRDLAEKAVATQSQNAASLAFITTELAAIATRLTTVEKVLKDVE